MVKKVYRHLQEKRRLWFDTLSMLWIRFICCIPSKHIRRGLLCLYRDVNIHRSVPLYHGLEYWRGPLTIGEGSSIGFRNHLDCRKGLFIGRNVCFASDVTIWTLHHDYNDISFRAKGAPVTIGDYAWLCSNCIVLPGVTIGEGAVIAAGAVVTSDVEPWTVVGGVPARRLSVRERKNYKYVPGNYWLPLL